MRSRLEDLEGRRVLLAASTGGHLAQLYRLAPTLGVDASSPWVTFDTPQSRGLLAGQEVHYVPYVAPRDYRGAARAAQQIRPLLRTVEGALSTGAALAVAVLPQARLMGKPAVYLESISRVNGPSLSGRILQRSPALGLYAQHSSWVKEPWKVGPSVLSTYATRRRTVEVAPRRLLVTLGTIAPYRFDRLVDTIKAFVVSRPEIEVLWQLGCTERDDLPGRSVDHLKNGEFADALLWADVVVSHAGVGTAMEILDAGHVPVLMARQRQRAEHVDDHQQQILDYLLARGLAFDASMIDGDDGLMTQAASRQSLRQAETSVINAMSSPRISGSG